MKKILGFIFAVLSGMGISSCTTIDDDRIPSMPVAINLSTPDLWNTYGVSGVGMYREFIREKRLPSNFAYTDRTYTGFGGVLLISGMDPFTYEPAPLAYDLSCPVERKQDVRVEVQIVEYVQKAVCPVCGSVYDVLERGGSPVDGPAFIKKYGLRRYECRPTAYKGYIISNI